MKPINLLILAFLFPMLMKAQNNATLTVGTTANFNLKMTFNGKNYTLLDKMATFQNLQPGSYPINIYQAQRKVDGTFDYVKVYEGNVHLKAGLHVEMMVLRFGKIAWDEGPYNYDPWTNGFNNPTASPAGTVNNTGNTHVMSDDAFQSLLNLLRKASGDYERKGLCPGLFKNNLFMAKQIASICAEFSDDYYRIDVAKMAYQYCYDKGSYFMVAEAFKGEYYKSSLLSFIAAQR